MFQHHWVLKPRSEALHIGSSKFGKQRRICEQTSMNLEKIVFTTSSSNLKPGDVLPLLMAFDAGEKTYSAPSLDTFSTPMEIFPRRQDISDLQILKYGL